MLSYSICVSVLIFPLLRYQ